MNAEQGTPADRFAIEHAHYDDDLGFWEQLADEHAAGEPVLDLGAAVGRVTLHLAARGHAVLAVDVDPAMLGELRRSADRVGLAQMIQTVQGDLRSLALGRRLPLVLMPMNTLQVFLTRQDQLAALRSVAAHLSPEGVFAFDVVNPDLAALGEVTGRRLAGETYEDPSGVVLHHASRIDQVDEATGTVRFTILVSEDGPDGHRELERHHTVHLYSPTELWELVAEAGMRVISVAGDFDGRPLTHDSERQVVRCEVAA